MFSSCFCEDHVGLMGRGTVVGKAEERKVTMVMVRMMVADV